MPRPRLLLSAAVIAVAVSLTGCIPLPPAIAPPAPVPVPQVQPVPTAAPIPTPTTPPPTPSPSPTPEPEPEPVGEVGTLWAGHSPTSSSGLSPDTPSTEALPPTSGTPQFSTTSPWGEDDGGNMLLPDQALAPTNLLQTATGRLWSQFPNGNWISCTATVINSATDNIAITAAHCLYDAVSGQMATHVEFAPGYFGGNQPFGLWVANRWWMPQFFIDTATATTDSSNGDGWAVDFGYVRFDPSASGVNIEAYTGGQGVSFRGETNGVLNLGYPTLAPYDGESMRYCSTNQPGFGNKYWPHFDMACAMTPGLSGGPWLTNVDPATGAGIIVAVNSTVGNGSTSGTPLGTLAASLLHELETT